MATTPNSYWSSTTSSELESLVATEGYGAGEDDKKYCGYFKD